ncbi:YacL family protein [Pseudoalteromonas sp. SSDWG2]|uniref:YacL family protein n=1 Tax=Pseudoalteromonas sp. SSDWG2 TaxID=3139391 RepID=UPI003BACCEAC
MRALLSGVVLMEYQLFSDPLWGKRIKVTDEHKLIARWFNDELYENESLQQRFIAALMSADKEVIIAGNEMRVILAHGEAIFESHGLYHDGDDLETYLEDDLTLDESELAAACGVEDLVALVDAWRTFR